MIEPQRWQQGRVAACRQALAAHGEPLRWAITAAEQRPEGQWLRLEAVLLV
ncbi:MAG: hypothetical protein ACPGVM_09560 [Prochlorococcaceae cyanobacterium]